MAGMAALRHIALATILLLVGWLLGSFWQQLIIDTFTETGAELIVTQPGTAAADLAAYTFITGAASLLAAAISAILLKVTGERVWPVWLLAICLLVGENLSVALRMVALATLTLPHAVGVAVATHTAPLLDLSEATIAPWAAGGMLGAGVILLGMLTVTGLLGQDDP
ncbi:MAG: hypothetical protein ACI8S6_001543 [Myxococcota bacterium]|jgi:hypothetical protein